MSPSRTLVVILVAAVSAGAQPPLPRDTLGERFWRAGWPYGLGEAPATWKSEVHEGRLALGRRLFFDPILSIDRSTSCASCHQPAHGFASPEALPAGANGARALRNAPTLFNRALGTLHSWDGKARDLKEQVVLPISNPNEMGLPLADALTRLESDVAYGPAFRKQYGGAPTREHLADALASFVDRLAFGDSAVDHFQGAKNRSALSVEERAGLWIYESKGRCWKCHSGPNFADERFHNTGVGAKNGVPEPGRQAVTGRPEDLGGFRTPTLRGLTRTAPYMHDGSLATLEDVVAFYRRGGNRNSHLDPDLKPLDLTDDDARHLVAFLKALSRPGR